MLQHLVSGIGASIIRRPLESATRTLPLIVALFLPILFFRHEVPLRPPGSIRKNYRKSRCRSFQQTYLTSGRFQARAVIYFVVWLVLMFIFNRLSKRQDVDQPTAPCAFASKCWLARASFFTFL